MNRSQQRVWRWSVLLCVMTVMVTACPNGGTQGSTFEVSGKILSSTANSGEDVQLVEATVINTSNIAGTPPDITFEIPEDLEFLEFDHPIYTCAYLDVTNVQCTAKPDVKLEGQSETSLKPFFQIVIKNAPVTTAQATVKPQAIAPLNVQIRILSPNLSAPLIFPTVQIVVKALPFDIRINKIVSKPLIYGAKGEFTLTAEHLSGALPNYIRIEENALVTVGKGSPIPKDYVYNVDDTNMLNAGVWRCTNGTKVSLELICNLLPIRATGGIPNPIAGKYPLLKVIVDVSANPTRALNPNCPRLYPGAGDGDTNPSNNFYGLGGWKPCLPMTSSSYSGIPFDLQVLKTHTPSTTTPNEEMTYTLTVNNNSAVNIPGSVSVTDTLPATAFATSPVPVVTVNPVGAASCTIAGLTITCTSSFGLTAGQSFSVTITATVKTTAIGQVTNTASIQNPFLQYDSNPNNNTVSDSFQLSQLDSSCDQAADRDVAGNVILPTDASDPEPPESVDENRGSLSSLYPSSNTKTDALYPLPCEPSIGGVLPTVAAPTQAEIDAEKDLSAADDTLGQNFKASLNLNPMPPITTPVINSVTTAECQILVGNSWNFKNCNDAVFLRDNMPFRGRDIIYVHGLAVSQLTDLISNKPQAKAVWPQDQAEFIQPGGYYYDYAESYWSDHISEHLTNGWQYTSSDPSPQYVSKDNRYLRIAWSSNQTIEYGEHAMLKQIQMAIANNTNVQTPPNYPTNVRIPFCGNGCIIISHSAGALLTDVTMGRAASRYGAAGQKIVDKMKAHIAFDGAISGSRLATLGIALSPALGLGVGSYLCTKFQSFLNMPQTGNCSNPGFSSLTNSILRDLIPAVAQGIWGGAISNSPVPTVTFAGGHPLGNYLVTSLLLPGIDDGVVTMNSACGNSNPVFPPFTPPSGMQPLSLLKAFEFSDNLSRLARGTAIYINQKEHADLVNSTYLDAACTPWLSPSGMVMPVLTDYAGTPLDARQRYNNHYSFMQSVSDHAYDGAGVSSNPFPSAATTPREYVASLFDPGIMVEETRAVTNAAIYTTTIDTNGTVLAKSVPMEELVRGKKISFRSPWNLGGCSKVGKGLKKYRCTKWLWKRTYHLADKWQYKQSGHYAYEFIAR